MRNKLVVLVMFVMAVTVLVSGCGKGEKMVKGVVKDIDTKVESENKSVVADDIAVAAKEEEVTKGELEKMVDELSRISAKKNGLSLEEYFQYVEDEGLTPYSIQKRASDYMGISLKAYYQYEVANDKPLTKEQKENNENIANALKEIEGMDLSEGNKEPGKNVEEMLGIYSNTSGEIREVMGDPKEMLLYKVNEITNEYEDEYSLVMDYNSNASVEVLVEYFDKLLKNTEEYMLLAPPTEELGMLQGTIDQTLVSVSVEKDSDNSVVSCYIDLTTKKY